MSAHRNVSASLRGRLGLSAEQGMQLTTCGECGCHTASAEGQLPVCWACGGGGKRTMLARVVILVVGETRIVWKALVTEGGWYTRCACGRILHQFHADGKPRPSHVQCPGCQKWTVAP